jgi:hypothetical protein
MNDIKLFETKETILLSDGIMDFFHKVIENRKYEITGIIAGCTDIKIGMKWLNLIQSPNNQFDRVYGAVKHQFIRLNQDCSVNEFTIQGLFKEHISEIIPGAKPVTNIKKDFHNKPDAFISFNSNKPIPVEVKLNQFNQKALNQLKRYCKAFKTRKGVAVGSECVVDLPPGFIFIANSELLKFRDEYEDKHGDSPKECLKKIRSELIFGILMYKSEYDLEFVNCTTNEPITTITPNLLSKILLSLFERTLVDFNGDSEC